MLLCRKPGLWSHSRLHTLTSTHPTRMGRSTARASCSTNSLPPFFKTRSSTWFILITIMVAVFTVSRLLRAPINSPHPSLANTLPGHIPICRRRPRPPVCPVRSSEHRTRGCTALGFDLARHVRFWFIGFLPNSGLFCRSQQVTSTSIHGWTGCYDGCQHPPVPGF